MIEIKKCNNIDLLKALWKESFSDTDEFINTFFSTAFSNDRFNSAYLDNELAGALYWFDTKIHGKKSAYIYAVATAKKHRKKGVSSCLLENTLNNLKQSGYEFAFLVPSNKGLFDFYKKLGFYICGNITELNFKKSETPLAFTEITLEEYLKLRQNFNEDNSLFEFPQNSAFIKSMLNFYKGEDFIFAAYKDNSKLYAKEFLGNTKKCSQILASFECLSGTFRIKGNEKPFVMGYTLVVTPPYSNIYFPFAFD